MRAHVCPLVSAGGPNRLVIKDAGELQVNGAFVQAPQKELIELNELLNELH